MPRQARPRWHSKRRQWYANIGERDAGGRAREVFAPPAIGEKQEDAAWEWFRMEKQRLQTRRPPDELSIEWMAEKFLAAVEDALPVEQFRNHSVQLGLACLLLGDRPVMSLEPDDVTDLGRTLLEKGYSPCYARNVCSSVRSMLKWAVREKLLAASPIRGYRSPTIPRSPLRFAERAEAAAFVRFWSRWDPRKPRSDGRPREPWSGTIRGRYERYTLLLVRCLIRTGARPKELCKLQWSDIVWDGWTTSGGMPAARAEIPYTRWKTGKVSGKPRVIYFTPGLTRSLRRLRDHAPNPTHVFVKHGGRGGVGKDEPWPSGSSLSKAILRVRRALITRLAELRARADAGDQTLKAWELRWAGLRVEDSGHQRLVNYRWRHTAISSLLMLGVDVPTVAELTGTSPDMIWKHYGHILSGHLERAAEKLMAKKRGSAD